MKRILADRVEKEILLSLDDIIFSEAYERQLDILPLGLTRLPEAGLKSHHTKCQLLRH